MATKAIPVVAAKVASTQTDFPVYVQPSTMTGWGALTLAEVESMRWYSDEALTTELASDPVSADEIHVKVPSLTTTTTIYVDYDGIRAKYAVGATYGRDAVWSDYAAVWHMNEDPSGSAPQLIDSTGSYPGTANGSMTSGDLVSGPLGNAIDFDGTNDYFDVNDAGALDPGTSDYTVSLWWKLNNTPAFAPIFGAIDISPIQNQLALYYFHGDRTLIGYFESTDGRKSRGNATDISTATWYYSNYTWDVSTDAIIPYLNGAADSGTAYNNTGNVTNIVTGFDKYIGARNNNNSSADFGVQTTIAELRLKKAVDSANWITTEYNNQNDVASFWGTVTDVAGGATSNNSARRMLLMQM